MNRRDWEASWGEEQIQRQVGESWTVARDKGSEKRVHRQTNIRDTKDMRKKRQRHRHAMNQDNKVYTHTHTHAWNQHTQTSARTLSYLSYLTNSVISRTLSYLFANPFLRRRAFILASNRGDCEPTDRSHPSSIYKYPGNADRAGRNGGEEIENFMLRTAHTQKSQRSKPTELAETAGENRGKNPLISTHAHVRL